MFSTDTIAAISSSIAPAPRIILRLSGPTAHDIAAQLTDDALPSPSSIARINLRLRPSPRNRREGRGEGPDRPLTFPSWLYLFTHPHSYTTENLIELHIPGNPLLARLLLDHLIDLGARHATPGEFTARAYLNGRLDLSEAEGVAATISAGNEDELRAARQLLCGELSRRLRPMMDALAETLALIEVGIDFSDQDITFLHNDEVRSRLTRLDTQLEQLITTSSRFERLTHEPHFVLVGRPNAGKSTLLNTLAGHDRAVVSPIPGTTRDAVSAQVHLARGLIRLTDVAGLVGATLVSPSLSPSPGTPGEGWGEGDLSSSPNADIDRKMQSHALRALESADHILLLHDITDPRPPLSLPRPPDLLILTKSDLLHSVPSPQSSALLISSYTRAGLPELRTKLDHLAFGSPTTTSTLALNARHLTTLAEARSALSRALSNLGSGPELLALDLRESLDSLGQILGHLSPDDLLGKVFSAFCIGK